MKNTSRCVAWSIRVYEMLIKAYPASFRMEYEDEMTLVFREFITDAWNERGLTGLLSAWFRVLGDLLWSAARENWIEIQRRIAMKTAAYAVLSFGLAVVTYSVVTYLLGWTIILPFFLFGAERFGEIAMIALLYLSAFLTGMILSRVKPFFMPRATVPLGIAAWYGIAGLAVLAESIQTGRHPEWFAIVAAIGFGASVIAASLVGCIVAARAPNRLARFSMPWFQVAGPLAVLVCTSAVAGVIQIMLKFNHLDQDVQTSLRFCLFALAVIGAVSLANLILPVVRNRPKHDCPVIEGS